MIYLVFNFNNPLMKKILFLLIGLLVSTSASADDLENVLNKVYDKGSKTAEGYLENLLDGPGDTEVSISAKNENKPTGTIMIVRPLSVNENDLTFYQAQLNSYHILGDTRQSINYGIGKRFLAEDGSSFLGVNSFFDADIEFNSRLGFGTEFRTSNFNVTGNYYLDVLGGANEVGSSTERVLDGYDFEIEGQVPYAPWANVSLTTYQWEAIRGSTDSEGDVYSTTLNLTNNLTLEAGYDDNNISDSMDYFKITYIYGGKNRPTIGDGFSNTPFEDSDVREEMLTKVKRSNIITLEVESTGVVISNGNS